MESREQRFERRVRGAGARTLAADDDDFGIALPGTRTPGTAAQKAQKKKTPGSKGSAGKRSSAAKSRPVRKQQLGLKPAVELEPTGEGKNDDDDNDKAVKRRKMSPEKEETQAESGPAREEDVEGGQQQENQQTAPSNSQISSSGTKRKRRKSVGQQSLFKKRQSQRSSDITPEGQETEQPSQAVNGAVQVEDSQSKEGPAANDKQQDAQPEESSVPPEQPKTKRKQRARKSTGGIKKDIDIDQIPTSPSVPGSPPRLPSDVEHASKSSEGQDRKARLSNGLSENTAQLNAQLGAQDDPEKELDSALGPENEATIDVTPNKTAVNQVSDRDIVNDSSPSQQQQQKKAIYKRKRRKSVTLPPKKRKRTSETVPSERHEADPEPPKRRGRPPKKGLTISKNESLDTQRANEEPQGLANSQVLKGKAKESSKSLPVSKRKDTKSTARSNTSKLGGAKKRRHPDLASEPDRQQPANTVPIKTYTITDPEFLSITSSTGEQPTSRLPPLIPTDPAPKPVPTAPDVLAQASDEIVQATLAKIISVDAGSKTEKAATRRIHGVVRAFGAELQGRLREMSQLVSGNGLLARRVKHGRKARKEILGEIMDARKERRAADERWFEFRSKRDLARKVRREDERITGLMEGLDAAVKNGRANEGDDEVMAGAEFDLQIIRERISRGGSKTGFVEKIKELSDRLEKAVQDDGAQ